MRIGAVVLGATGYVGGELLRLIVQHPHFEPVAAVSGSQSGNSIASVFPHLQHALPSMPFCSMDDWHAALDSGDKVAVFSAAPHGASAELVQQVINGAAQKKLDLHIVDSSADFRYPTAAAFENVYGGQHAAPGLLPQFNCALPEHADHNASHIGHPGCFATAMLLATVPLFRDRLIHDQVFVSAITGSTGSGRSPQTGTHHPERHGNLYAYKPLAHRHAPEVENLIMNASGQAATVNFVPHSGPFARGIYATVQAGLREGVSDDAIRQSFGVAYGDATFVQLVDDTPRLKNVVASNYAHIGVECRDGRVVVMCAIDNLVKGAAGGAMQWMNRLWSLPEDSGLQSPPPAWT